VVDDAGHEAVVGDVDGQERRHAAERRRVRFDEHFSAGSRATATAILERTENFALAEPMPTPAHDPSYFLRPMRRLPITFSRR